MFFIGGFGSIIPYLIYLSLIWTFVILSFGGKIAAFLHKPSDKEIISTQVTQRHKDAFLLRCYNYPTDQQTKEQTPVSESVQSPSSFPPLHTQLFRIKASTPYLPDILPYSFRLRGPPLFS